MGISTVSADLILNSWAPSSISQYDCGLRKWSVFCKDQGYSPFDINVTNLLNFIGELSKTLSYSSVMSCKAAVFAFANCMGIKLEHTDLIERALKGLFRAKPSMPKYSTTWRVEDLLTFIKSLGPNQSLELKDLTLKCLCLLVLSCPRRSSEIASLKIENFLFSDDKISIPVGIMNKNRARGQPPQIISISYFLEDEVLCPVMCLREYLLRTLLFRTEGKTLFISFISPYASVNSTTLARWVKLMLERAGIHNYGAHSMRAATTSAAVMQGVSLNTILSAAAWRGSSSFERFYKKDTFTESFQEAVLKKFALK